jgi:hypothetical protein
MRLIIVIVLLAIIMYFVKVMKKPSYPVDGKWKVYGSMKCGWTKKQLDQFKSKGINHVFVDCDKEKCDFVAFPTLVHSQSGEKIVGYTEKISV